MKLNRKPKEIHGVDLKYSSLPEFPRPKFTSTLRFPDDITELASANVSDLHGKYTQLFTFVNQELSRVNQELLRKHTEENQIRNVIFRERPTINSQERWKRDAVVSEDPRMESIAADVQGLNIQKLQLQMFVDNYEKYLTALSRELSRKGAERDYGR